MTYAMTDNTVFETIEPKQLVPEETWKEMSIDQLIDEKNILFSRWMYLVERKYPYASDVKKGLDKIEAFIATR